MTIRIKRAYDPPEAADGFRVLVDRLWPRGIKTEDAHVDLWMRDVSPSTELREWFGHDPERWDEFKERYERELKDHGELLDLLIDTEKHRKTVTLVYGARDTEHNQAVVLRSVLDARAAHAH